MCSILEWLLRWRFYIDPPLQGTDRDVFHGSGREAAREEGAKVARRAENTHRRSAWTLISSGAADTTRFMCLFPVDHVGFEEHAAEDFLAGNGASGSVRSLGERRRQERNATDVTD